MQGKTGEQQLINVDLILEKAGISERMKIADLGCGATGCFVFACADLAGKEGKVFAIDILKEVLSITESRIKQENIQNVVPVWSDLEVFGATKVESSSLDVALLINTLFQSVKRVEIIREAARLLKKNGRLVVVEWKSIALPFGPPASERVKIELLKTGVQKLGLHLEDEFEAGPYHYGLVFSK